VVSNEPFEKLSKSLGKLPDEIKQRRGHHDAADAAAITDAIA